MGALVLGCARLTQDGRLNLFFKRRIEAASELFRSGRVQYLLLSGDNSKADYDEPSEMRSALIEAAVPARASGLNAFGFDAEDIGGREGLWMAGREALSRLCAVLDVRVLHTRPRFSGPREVVPW
jgi:SanA protein